MALIKKRGLWVLLMAIMQLIILYVAEHFFTKDINEVANSTALSLSKSGMAAEQVSTIASAISSIGNNVRWFVTGTGVSLILINLGIIINLVLNTKE
jgi:hypothetical protein